MSGIAPITFVGVSSYSEDFQAILSRAQQIAALPLNSLQNDKSILLQRQTLTTTLSGVASSFTASLANLKAVGDSRGISGTSSDSAKVSIGSVTATTPATYRISEVTSLAAAASETSVAGYATSDATPVSSTGTVRLTIGSEVRTITLTPETNNLNGLRNAINNLGVGVTASIFTTGTGSDPNYLSLTATSPGATTLSLVDDPDGAAAALVTAANQGANTVFKLNGVTVSKTTSTINDVVAGVTFTILDTTDTGETIDLNLRSNRTNLSTALNSLVSAYNTYVDFLDTQIGESAGLLTGSSLIQQSSAALRQLVNFNGAGSVDSLSDLGLSLDRDGRLSFDQSAFDALSESAIAAGFEFVSGTQLGGQLETFESISDPVTGSIKLELDQNDRTENTLNSRIDILTERINEQQAALEIRLQAADTLLATLESQKRTIDASLESLSLVLYGKSEG